MVLDAPETVAVAVLTTGAGDGDGDAAADGEFVVPQATAASTKLASNAPRTPKRAVMVSLRGLKCITNTYSAGLRSAGTEGADSLRATLQRLSRGYVTWLLYALFGCMAFLLNGLGAVLAPLQTELGVKRGDVAFYPSLFALGLVVVGLSGGSVVGRLGRRATLRLAIGGIVLGGVLFAVPGRVPTLFGALLLGLGSALLIQLMPALLAAIHEQSATAAIGEANGVASATSVVAPLAVGAALSVGLGWRIGYLGLPLLALSVAFIPAWRLNVPVAQTYASDSRSRTVAPLLGRWFDLLVAVSAEFCMIFWAASAMGDWHHATAAQAPALASLFLVGMATTRFLASPITRLLAETRVLILTSIGVAAAGFALFWSAPNLIVAAAGLAVTGIGIAMLYPTFVSLVIATWPQAPDRAAARAALASGLAIGVTPFLLGRLSDTIGLHAAYLIVPALLVVLAARSLIGPDSPSSGSPRPDSKPPTPRSGSPST